MSERVEPPAEHRGVRWHWLMDDIQECEPEPWDWQFGMWIHVTEDLSPEQVAERGYRYLAPCIPPEPCDV